MEDVIANPIVVRSIVFFHHFSPPFADVVVIFRTFLLPYLQGGVLKVLLIKRLKRSARIMTLKFYNDESKWILLTEK